MSNSNKIKLTKYKLTHLYSNIIKVLGLKGKVASILDISPKTLDDYLSQAQGYIDEHDEKLEAMYDIDTDSIDERYEQDKSSMLDEYLRANNLTNIGDKYRHNFESYFYRKRELEREKYIYYLEQNHLDNIVLSDNEDEDKKIKLLILFKRIWDRAQLAFDSELCATVDKHSKSSKNVGLAFKLLEKRNRDDLGEAPQKQIVEGTVTHNITSFAQLANAIQEQRRTMIEAKEDIIDAEYENIVDEKEQ